MTQSAAEKPFRKDLGHLDWDAVFARQAQRGALVDAWMEGLQLKPGDRILEIGSGPGYVSLALAERVGPAGIVYAVDRSAEALDYLARLQQERSLAQIRRILADAASLEAASVPAESALITMVLHHAEDPAGLLLALGRLLPPGALAVIGEFHPAGRCRHGPPREHRLAPEQVQGWCEVAGFAVAVYRRQTPEHYMLVARRQP